MYLFFVLQWVCFKSCFSSVCFKWHSSRVYLNYTHQLSFHRHWIKEGRGGWKIYTHKRSDATDPGWHLVFSRTTFNDITFHRFIVSSHLKISNKPPELHEAVNQETNALCKLKLNIPDHCEILFIQFAAAGFTICSSVNLSCKHFAYESLFVFTLSTDK